MIAVLLTVHCEDPAEVARSMEVLGRAAAGIALDGQTVNLSVVTVEDEED